MFAALGIDVSDVLLYFLESALNFPARGMKLEHLFCRNYFDMASERLGHAEQLGELNFSVFVVNMDYGWSCSWAESTLTESSCFPNFGW